MTDKLELYYSTYKENTYHIYKIEGLELLSEKSGDRMSSG
jgi:hypothetical protein